MTTLQERLNEVMNETGLKQADLVRATGQKSSSVYAWIHGPVKNLRGPNLVILARLFNVEEAWLATGEGPKYRQFVGGSFLTIPRDRYNLLSDTQKKAIEEWVDRQITAYTGVEPSTAGEASKKSA